MVALVIASFSDFVDLIEALVWPLVVALALYLAATDRGQRLLRPILRRVRKVSGPGGFALELSEEAAAATKADVEGVLGEFSSALGEELDRLAYAHDVRNRLSAVFDLAVREATEGLEKPDYRSTVHMRDPLYVDALYQLVDYWPSAGGGGRRHSIRFGMLGRASRLGTSLYKEDIPTDPEALIGEWGMSREQAARAGHGRRSFLCLVLRDRGSLVGVLYMDAMPANAFPLDIVSRLEGTEPVEQLASAVGRVHREIASRGPGLKLLQSD